MNIYLKSFLIYGAISIFDDLLEGKTVETGIGFELCVDEDEHGNSIEIKNEYQIKIL
jgi:hypothetical protein